MDKRAIMSSDRKFTAHQISFKRQNQRVWEARGIWNLLGREEIYTGL